MILFLEKKNACYLQSWFIQYLCSLVKHVTDTAEDSSDVTDTELLIQEKFDFELYNPDNTVKVMSSRSDNLLSLFLGRR